MPNSSIGSVLVDPSNPNLVIIGVNGGAPTFASLPASFFPGGIYRSSDGGTTWNYVASGPNDTANSFLRLISRGSSPLRYLGVGTSRENPTINQGLFTSPDRGASWSLITTTPATGLNASFDASRDGVTIFAGVTGSFDVRKSVDSGATWTTIPTSVARGNGAIAVSPVDPLRVLVEGGGTLYLSEDGLASTRAVATAPTLFDDVVFAPVDPNIVYAVARGYLVYRSADAGSTFTFVKNVRNDVLNVIP